MRWSVIFFFMFGLWLPAGAQASRPSPFLDQSGTFAGFYHCQSEAAAGVVPSGKAWAGRVFDARSEAFDINLQSAGMAEVASVSGASEAAMRYSAEIAPVGTNPALGCHRVPKAPLTIRIDGMLQCQFGSTELRFDAARLRFLAITVAGPIDGSEEASVVLTGTCTRR